MKVTIAISDALFQSAKQFAQENQTTLSGLIEEGLRLVLRERIAKPKEAFKRKNASVRGIAMLITDPDEWQSEETKHLTRTLLWQSVNQ